jgi:hypothetical protein
VKALDNARGWVLGAAGAMVLVTVISWLMVFSPKLSDTSAVHDQTAALKVTDAALVGQIAVMKTQRAHMHRYVARLVAARLGLPITASLPAFSAQSDGQAATAGVTLTGMNVGTVALASAVTAAPVTAGTPSAATVGATPGQLYGIPVTLVSTGPYGSQLHFLQMLQDTGPRVALVTGAAFAGTDESTNIDAGSTLTTALTLFVAPQTPAEATLLKKQLSGRH